MERFRLLQRHDSDGVLFSFFSNKPDSTFSLQDIPEYIIASV